MCAERIQRFLMAIVLAGIMVLFITGFVQTAAVLQSFIVVIIVIWAFADFCPSLWVFKKMFGSCHDTYERLDEH